MSGGVDGQPCPGAGKCHGCLKWCEHCGNVKYVCDIRVYGERCDVHRPVLPADVIEGYRKQCEKAVVEARIALRQAEAELDAAVEAVQERKEYDLQCIAREQRARGINR